MPANRAPALLPTLIAFNVLETALGIGAGILSQVWYVHGTLERAWHARASSHAHGAGLLSQSMLADMHVCACASS
jgi:hypothetical protein